MQVDLKRLTLIQQITFWCVLVTSGVDASPLMTWGSIEGSPFRLDGGDTPITGTPGPTFKMPEPKKRDQLGLALAEKVSRQHREKRRQALAQATALIGR